MPEKQQIFESIIDAAWRGDLSVIREMVTPDFDRSITNQSGDSILSGAISELCIYDDMRPHRYDVVRTLLELGFDPNQLDDEGMGPLTMAMLPMDTEMLRLLLNAGARPNDYKGFSSDDTLYSWAMMDYMYNVWDINKFPEAASETDMANEDAWLAWLDHIAIKYERRRPDHLQLLRERGARTWFELN